jgi:hypothetical protein
VFSQSLGSERLLSMVGIVQNCWYALGDVWKVKESRFVESSATRRCTRLPFWAVIDSSRHFSFSYTLMSVQEQACLYTLCVYKVNLIVAHWSS